MKLTEIFSKRFFRKTTSTLTDDDVCVIVDLYVNHLMKMDDIAKRYNTNRGIIRRILKNCVDEHVLKETRGKICSLLVNQNDRKKRQVETWRANNPDWKSPMLNPTSIKNMLITRAKNKSYKPENNFGNTTGPNNGRFIKVDRLTVLKINELLTKKASIPTIASIVSLSKEKVIKQILDNKIMSESELSLYRKKAKSFPEFMFEQQLLNERINYVAQYRIAYTKQSGRKAWKLYDFYIPQLNLLIEIDGKCWHDVQHCIDKKFSAKHISKVMGIALNDKLKTELAQKLGFSLMRITDFSKESFNKISDELKESMNKLKYETKK